MQRIYHFALSVVGPRSLSLANKRKQEQCRRSGSSEGNVGCSFARSSKTEILVQKKHRQRNPMLEADCTSGS